METITKEAARAKSDLEAIASGDDSTTDYTEGESFGALLPEFPPYSQEYTSSSPGLYDGVGLLVWRNEYCIDIEASIEVIRKRYPNTGIFAEMVVDVLDFCDRDWSNHQTYGAGPSLFTVVRFMFGRPPCVESTGNKCSL